MASSALHSEYLGKDQIVRLHECRQGDVLALPHHVWIAHGDLPTTAYGRDYAAPGKVSSLSEVAPNGVAVLTPTCDFVPRSGRDRPYVAVAPLVGLEEPEFSEARRGRHLRYVHLPSYEDGRYFADLDRISTIETGVLLIYSRSASLTNDRERSDFARALARKFGRFAFPDDLQLSMKKWRDHVISKHNKPNSPEGVLYQKAVDVRLSVDGEWFDDKITVTVKVLFPPGFLPIPDPNVAATIGAVQRVNAMKAPAIAQKLYDGVADLQAGALMCERLQELWADRCEPTGSIQSIEFELLGTDDMTVDVYLASQSFDLEFLSPA